MGLRRRLDGLDYQGLLVSLFFSFSDSFFCVFPC